MVRKRKFRVKKYPSTARRKMARAHRKMAKLVIGRKKFAVRVTCRGKIAFTRAGRKHYSAVKKALKLKCKVGRKHRTVHGTKNMFGRTGRSRRADKRRRWL